jgi:RNA polymerase sigma-70 factor (ECF subfamily)
MRGIASLDDGGSSVKVGRMTAVPNASSNSSRDTAPYADADWLARVRVGDVQAFEALVHHYSDRLCAFVYNYLRDAEQTRELVQDLFLWIWRHRHEWEIRGGLTTYLYHSARNRAISRIRHERLERRWQEEMGREGAAREFGRPEPLQADAECRVSDLRDALARALEELPDRCREVFLLSREHGLTYSQIGEMLGIAPKTVEVHMGRALASLRKSLSDWME